MRLFSVPEVTGHGECPALVLVMIVIGVIGALIGLSNSISC